MSEKLAVWPFEIRS